MNYGGAVNLDIRKSMYKFMGEALPLWKYIEFQDESKEKKSAQDQVLYSLWQLKCVVFETRQCWINL